MFLAVGIVAVLPVDDGTGFADDGDIALSIGGDHGATVFRARRMFGIVEDLLIGVKLHTGGEIKDFIIVAVVAAEEQSAGFQKQRRIRPHPQG